MIYTDPVLGKDFFGREQILSKLNKKLNSLNSGFRQNVALLGPALSGKTSILKYFLTKFENDKFLFFYLEVKGSSFEEFIRKFLSSFLSSLLSKTDEFNKLAIIDNQTLLSKFQVYLPKTAPLVSELFVLLDKSKFNKVYEKLFEILESAKKEISKPLIIILEEFPRLLDLGIKSPFEILGKKLLIQKDIMFVLSSSSVNEARRIITEKLSLLFCNFEVIEVQPFDYFTSKEFINKRCANINLEGVYKNFIITLTEGRPFYLNTICSKLSEVASMHGHAISSRNLINKCLEELVFKSNGILNQYLSSRLYNLEADKKFDTYAMVLLHLANDNQVSEISSIINKSNAEVNKLLRTLTQRDFLSKFGSFYRFNDRLFKFWTSLVFAVKESPYKKFYVDGKDFFSSKNIKILDSFIKENGKSVIERSVELFKLFSNDMVELSNQRFMLPRFETIYSTCIDEKSYKIIASSETKKWLIFLTENKLTENKLAKWITREKPNYRDFKKKLLITLVEPDIATNLLAKQEKILPLNIFDLNTLFELYGKPLLLTT